MLGRLVIATLLAGTLGSGGALAAESAPPRLDGDTVDPAILDGSAQRSLDAARERWTAEGFRSYRLQLSRSCFCPPAGNLFTVTVGGGKLTRPAPPEVAEVATVPRQFRLVQRAIGDRVSGLSVRYGSRGNPVAIAIDTRRLIVDEEISYRTHRMTRAGRR